MMQANGSLNCCLAVPQAGGGGGGGGGGDPVPTQQACLCPIRNLGGWRTCNSLTCLVPRSVAQGGGQPSTCCLAVQVAYSMGNPAGRWAPHVLGGVLAVTLILLLLTQHEVGAALQAFLQTFYMQELCGDNGHASPTNSSPACTRDCRAPRVFICPLSQHAAVPPS